MQPQVTDHEIETAFAGTNFGACDKKELLAKSVVKRGLGFHCGSTITQIMVEMRLITPKLKTPTRRGGYFSYETLGLGGGG